MAGEPVWQRDFPIGRAQEGAISRREFLRFLTLSSLAFFVGSVGVAARRVISPLNKQLPRLRIASLAQVPAGKSFTFTYPDRHSPALLVHLPSGELVAYDQRCTHLRCPVYYDAGKDRLECPCHEGAFDARTGARTAGPPPLPLSRIHLELVGQDIYAVGKSA